MQTYDCPQCGARLWFENSVCGCGHAVSYDPLRNAMASLGPHCANREAIGCNWSVSDGQVLCLSCSLTRTHPDVAVEDNRALWRKAEAAKRWVLVQMMRLGWFGPGDPGIMPAFDFLSEKTQSGRAEPTMGHADGLITINVMEADPSEVVHRRERLGEPYRTMIGHVRHEVAHFLFLVASQDHAFLDRFRTLFGDEQSDYTAALDRHYSRIDDGSWSSHHITHYASAHPHEDWAETAAHVLHLLDLLDSTRAVKLSAGRAGDVLDLAMEVAIAVNHLNRSLGTDAPYPFVVAPAVREKMEFALATLDRTDGVFLDTLLTASE